MQMKDQVVNCLVELYKNKIENFKININEDYLSQKIENYALKRENFSRFLINELDLLENDRDFRSQLENSIENTLIGNLKCENVEFEINENADDTEFIDLIIALFLDSKYNNLFKDNEEDDLVNSVKGRGKVYWTASECAYLIEGVNQYGQNWSVIYEKFKDKFHSSRTPTLLASRYQYMKRINRYQDENTKYKINN